MSLSPEQQKELKKFPSVLRVLIEAELAAGNSIEEVGHSHPAPPVGAYFKLTKKVSTRARASGDGLDFYDRNSSIYSGEFTDAKRFFFVLEPPNPPPPEPDMDAIRKARDSKPDSLVQLAERRAAGSSIGIATDESSAPEQNSASRRSLTSTYTATSSKLVLHFQDRRPPHEVQFALERRLMTLFATAMDGGKLCMLAKAKVVGTRYFFELRFEAALFLKNCYSLRVEASWAEQPVKNHDYCRKTFDSWFSFWTRDLMPANPPAEDAGSAEHYRKLSEAALLAEAHLDSVPAIQQAIIAEMKDGRAFGTSHKEGGTNIYWRGGTFVRSDYGDYPDEKQFSSEDEFLNFLRQFYDWETSSAVYPDKVSDFDAWKLILRTLRSK